MEKKLDIVKLTLQKSITLESVTKMMEELGDIRYNYSDYMITEPVCCDEELKRVSGADYELCTALLTMLMREDYFCNGRFEKRCENKDVERIIRRMAEVLHA